MPTGSVLKHRQMATDDSCPLCGAVDTWKHAPITCPMMASVCALAPEELVQHMVEREEENPKEWLFAIHDLLSQEVFDQLVVTLWALWGVRRKAVHENLFQPPHSVNSFISSYLSELQLSNAKCWSGNVRLSSYSVSGGRQSKVRPSAWLAPVSANVKLNVDAGVSRHGFGAVGVICRDQNGMFMGASTLAFRNIVDPPTLEALTIREALALAEDIYLRWIQVASDCKVVVQELSKDNSTAYGAVIHEIMDHSSFLIYVALVMNLGAQILKAHNVAKHALSLQGGRHVRLRHPRNLLFIPINIVTSQ